jgi:integrase/recombinase XerD
LSKHATAVATTTPEPADPAVARFLDAVWMERGLSANTLAAYRADLTALSRWLGERAIQMSRTTKADLQGFYRRPRCGRRTTALDSASIIQFPPFLSLPDA